MTISGVFTHINLLHSALLWAAIWPPFPLQHSPCDWMPGSVPGLMGPEKGQREAGNGGGGGFWWWPAAWKGPAHPSWQSLSFTVIRPGSGCALVFTACRQKCSLCWGVVKLTLLIAVIIALFTPVELVGKRVVCWLEFVCEKVERQCGWYHPSSERWHSIFPVCKSV